ncbi:MAG: hypothetical protein ACPG32_00350 [Akkermansiaceae bacterium]
MRIPKIFLKLKNSWLWKHRVIVLSISPFALAGVIGLGIYAWQLHVRKNILAEVDATYHTMKVDWTAQGESIGVRPYLSGPVPPHQNYHEHPAFLAELNDKHSPTLMQLDYDGIVGMSADIDYESSDYSHGTSADLQRWLDPQASGISQKQAAERCLKLYAPINQRLDALKQATLRPQVSTVDPIANYDAMTDAHMVSRRTGSILARRAILFLASQQPQQALSDVTALHRILKHSEKMPCLLGLVCHAGILVSYQDAVSYGLLTNKWTEAELHVIAQQLDAIDLPQHLHKSLRAEAGFMFGEIQKLLAQKEVIQKSDFSLRLPKKWDMAGLETYYEKQKKSCAPDAFNVMAHLEEVDFLIKHVIYADGPSTSTITPKTIRALFASPRSTYKITLTPLVIFQISQQNLHAAVAVSRYRLHHGTAPKSLGDLIPAYLPKVPHGAISGKDLHYHIKPDGTAVIYSEGQDQHNDGGDPDLDDCFQLPMLLPR